MPDIHASNWRQRCGELGLDPQEVKSVSKRYDMYHEYTRTRSAELLDLERWYKWYRIEKLSEGHAMLTPPEPGCSVSSDLGAPTEGEGVVSEADFLQLLRLYRGVS